MIYSPVYGEIAFNAWQKPYDDEPPVWFHDIFREDGTVYRQAEVDYIRNVTNSVDDK